MSTTILLIEDDPTIRMATEFSLTRAGYAVSSCDNGAEGYQVALRVKPSLILLDLMLPGMNGFEITERLRKTDQDTPIIMLTALDRPEDKVRGLDAGADDYLTKPFSTEELLARIRANIRRANYASPQHDDARKLSFGDLEIDVANARVRVKGGIVELRGKEYALLLALARRPGALCTREWLSQEVWNEEFLPTSRTIDVHVRRIRKAVETRSDYTYIQTVHGMGYRFEAVEKSS
ncbi:MAG: response regulator transcription factor [Coriobacteriales bacterium]